VVTDKGEADDKIAGNASGSEVQSKSCLSLKAVFEILEAEVASDLRLL
jgi:hypothetical protein